MDRRLRLIQGGAAGQRDGWGEGPITRLDLWSRAQPISSKVFAFLLFGKLALLASLLYFMLGR